MTNAEIIQAIKAEIERLMLEAKENCPEQTINRNYTPTQWQAIGEYNAYEIVGLFLSTLESEKPINPEDAMKELDEKIALVKQRGTWDGVDVDKYMDEVRGREPEKPMNQEGLEEEYKDYVESDPVYSKLVNRNAGLSIARHFAQWQKQHDAELIEIAYNDGITVGMTKQKEQMMKEAVEGTAHPDDCEIWVNLVGYGYKFNDGDKVRIIIIKDDGKSD